MQRLTRVLMLLTLAGASSSVFAQDAAATLQSYFTGKEVVVKIDMPGSQKGVDLRFNNPSPMNWKEYSSRLKEFGASIRKGDQVRVTGIVVKKDAIEFQLDGGGFGTFGDDTTTTVTAKHVDKSDYEKSLEKQISETTNEDKKRSLQRDLDRERARRQRLNAANRSDANVASQIKAQNVADSRMRGGSRFNLRWAGSIPKEQLTPESVTAHLAEYIDFGQPALASDGPSPGAMTGPSPASDGEPTANLKRGMKMTEVAGLLGTGRQVSESVSNDGLKTQVLEYLTADRHVEVTYVEGVVVRFSIGSR